MRRSAMHMSSTSTVSSSGLLIETSRGPQRWLLAWSILLVRKGWETWDRSDWRWEEWGGILSTLTNILRVDVKQIISMVPSNRTRGNGHKFKHRKFYLNMRKNFTVRMTEHRNKLPREAEESLWRYSKPFQMLSCTTYSRETALAGDLDRWSPEVPSKPYNSVILQTSPLWIECTAKTWTFWNWDWVYWMLGAADTISIQCKINTSSP